MSPAMILLAALLSFLAVPGLSADMTGGGCQPSVGNPGPATASCPAPVVAPAGPGGNPVSPTDALRADHVFFLRGGSALDPAAMAQLEALARLLESSLMRETCVRLVGHADAVGNGDVNQRLSLHRAEAVAAYLRPRLELPQRIVEVRGEGSSHTLPGLAATDPRHRRVTLMLRHCQTAMLVPG